MSILTKLLPVPKLTFEERSLIHRKGYRAYLSVARMRLHRWWAAKSSAAPVTDLDSPGMWKHDHARPLESRVPVHHGLGDCGSRPLHRAEVEVSLLTPVINAGGGRTGTTLLMQLLATSPQIAFTRIGAFENRFLTYLLRWAQLLGPKPTPDGLTEIRRAIQDLDAPLGHVPWPSSHLLGPDFHDGSLWKSCFLHIWRAFSRSAAANPAGTTQPAAVPVRYYAEKVASPWVTEQIRGLLPFKEIYTLRDPRDVWLSALSFNEKRGFDAFGRRPEQSDEEYLESFVNSQKAKLAYLAQLRESDSVMVVRYENMIQDLPKEAGRLSEFLGVTLDAAAVASQTKEYRHHMTSSSPVDSVRRWKRELKPQYNARFVAQLGPYLDQLGYAA